MLAIWASVFIVLCSSSAPSNIDLKSGQFILKSLMRNDFQSYYYQPLKIYTKVIEDSFSDFEITKALSLNLAVSAKIISDLLFVKLSTEQIRLGANNKCADILLSQKFQRKDIDADIAIFAVSNKGNVEIITSKKCEVDDSNFVKAIAIEINSEEFKILEDDFQVKELCFAIVNALYGNEKEEEKQILVSEIRKYFIEEKNTEAIKVLGACQEGQNFCEICADADKCLKCASGYSFIDGICQMCIPPCKSCEKTTDNCLSCYDYSHMSLNQGKCSCTGSGMVFYRPSLICLCNYGNTYIKDGNCKPCSLPCAGCKDSDSFCTGCAYSYMSLNLTTGICTCNSNSYFNNITTQCECNEGYYRYGGVCVACGPPCLLCKSDKCIACYDEIHMTASSGICKCKDAYSYFSTETLKCQCKNGYFDNNSGVCIQCNQLCATCLYSANFCTSCPNASYQTLNPETGTCTCKSGYFSNDPGVCIQCNQICSTCSNSATFCTSCSNSAAMTLNQETGKCTCKSGYFTTSTGSCTQCNKICSTCSNSANFCTSCANPEEMTLNCATGTCTCTDPNSTYNQGSNTCQCNSGYISLSGKCICKDGYYTNSSGYCNQCNKICSTCSNSANFCTSCANPAEMTLNSATGACTCTDPHSTYNQGSNNCQCNSGYISYSGKCKACTLPCTQCSSSDKFCTACADPSNMYLNTALGTCRCWDPYASLNETSKTCQCRTGYYKSSFGDCQPCTTPCSQCSKSETFCTACNDPNNMSLNPTTGTCKCKDPLAHFNPWIKACQTKPGCDCMSSFEQY